MTRQGLRSSLLSEVDERRLTLRVGGDLIIQEGETTVAVGPRMLRVNQLEIQLRRKSRGLVQPDTPWELFQVKCRGVRRYPEDPILVGEYDGDVSFNGGRNDWDNMPGDVRSLVLEWLPEGVTHNL